MSLHRFLYLIIFIEGYAVLAAELLAIRILIPFVGNGTQTIAIIIAAVLMPLAFGYYEGGRYHKKCFKRKPHYTLRHKLISNILRAATILTFGLSYAFLDTFFPVFELISNGNRIIQTILFSCIFLVYPVFLLGQTIPLISHYFVKQHLSEATSKILFFSTAGSFFGSILSTLVLISVYGVHNTVIITICLLSSLALLLSKRVLSMPTLKVTLILSIVILFNSPSNMQRLGIIEHNNYSTITVTKAANEEGNRILNINRSISSKYAQNPTQKLAYLQYVENTILPLDNSRKSILIIGAGGFTMGLNDTTNDYTYVDIDSSLKHISEEFFLKQELSKNKTFIAEPARAFLRNNQKRYDLIFLDVYSNAMNIPPQLITKEFFTQVKNSLNPNGVMGFNTIGSPTFEDRYSIKLDNTLRSVFPNLNRHIVQTHNVWQKDSLANIVYSFVNQPANHDIYTDNKNTYFLDK